MTPSNELLLEAVDDAARLAGGIAFRRFHSGIAVEWKSDGSEVTAADRESEGAVREWIARRFPDDGIVGEELGVVERPASRTWYVDPIDGTTSFVRGIPLWGSLVAVAVEGRVVAGAICCPAVGETIVAAEGAGCWLNGARTRVSEVDRVEAATVLATDQRFRTHADRAPRWAALTRECAVARTWGDCYGYLLVASGRAEVMADDRLNPWDVAPLLPIISEAGGVLTDWSGHRDFPARDGLATNRALATAVRERLDIPWIATPGTTP